MSALETVKQLVFKLNEVLKYTGGESFQEDDERVSEIRRLEGVIRAAEDQNEKRRLTRDWDNAVEDLLDKRFSRF